MKKLLANHFSGFLKISLGISVHPKIVPSRKSREFFWIFLTSIPPQIALWLSKATIAESIKLGTGISPGRRINTQSVFSVAECRSEVGSDQGISSVVGSGHLFAVGSGHPYAVGSGHENWLEKRSDSSKTPGKEGFTV